MYNRNVPLVDCPSASARAGLECGTVPHPSPHFVTGGNPPNSPLPLRCVAYCKTAPVPRTCRAVQRSSVTQRLATAKPKVRAEGQFGTSPFALFAYFAVQSFLLRRPYPAVTPEPTARKPPRRSARFSTANNANNANGPATTQAPGEAFDLRTRVAGSDALSLRSVNRER